MFNIFNPFKSCRTDESDDEKDALNSNELIIEQKNLTEPLYDINNQTDRYVQIFDNVLLPEECEKIIKLFEKHRQHHYIGKTLGDELLYKAKHTNELNITSLSKENQEVSELDNLLYSKLQIYLERYVSKIHEDVRSSSVNFNNIIDTGYQIQKYKKNKGYYVNHVDSHIYNNKCIHNRIITYIWYLNDISEGGETNFVKNFKIKPVAGRLLLFPSTWSYPHAGLIPISSDKYIITGWIYEVLNY